MTESKIFNRCLQLERLLHTIKTNKERNKDIVFKYKDKTIKNIDLIIKYLERKILILEAYLEGNVKARRIISSSPNDIPIYKERYKDNDGRIYEVQGILESPLNFHWKKFDLHYTGDLRPGYYLIGLNAYLNNKVGLKKAKVTLIKK